MRSHPILFALTLLSAPAFAGTDGGVSGVVTDTNGRPLGGVVVELIGAGRKPVATTLSAPDGGYKLDAIPFGDYELKAHDGDAGEFASGVHVVSDVMTPLDVTLTPKATIVIRGRRLATASASVQEVSKADISTLPQGEDIKLPKLLGTTIPGVVQGPFGQSFIRGNHANIQYQIDGVQLPDSPSNTFGDAFSPRNIDHMEVFTGGIPAEYGERLAAVVNIITKSGAQEPGGNVSLSYGSYATLTPAAEVSGSTKTGAFKYYASTAYTQTNRGLDTPQPESETDQRQGGRDAVHDRSTNDNEFVKFDWVFAKDTLSLIAFNAREYYEIPNYPAAFKPTDPFFQPTFTDQFHNQGGFNYVPPDTDDYQTERNQYTQVVWKHMVSDNVSWQLAPYWKGSTILVANDPKNDLAAARLIPGSAPSSFAEDRTTDNYGLKGDVTVHAGSAHRLKTGFQGQTSESTGAVTVLTPAVATTDTSPDKGQLEAAYLQDDITVTKRLKLDLGVRFDATQFEFGGENTYDHYTQPRAGIGFQLTETTSLHLFYGKLFQPAPVEDLRDTLAAVGQGTLKPYDLKAEKDDYYEAGISQVLGPQALTLNTWYKNAKNMLDDVQLLNTSIAQPYNYAQGIAYGTELALSGKLTDDWSEFLNYSYEIARGKGIGGGIFAFNPPNNPPPADTYVYLDHCEINTANAGIKFHSSGLWWTLTGNYGSGLRTGPDNTLSLPSHVTGDTTLGYGFGDGKSLLSGFTVAGDVLNISDNRYPISIANGFNGSHYAAGREYFMHLSKEL